jgi:uncharacterized membrane protein YidH (DUF202 family)
VAAEPHAVRSGPRLAGWAGFWLWALVGAAVVLGFVSLTILLLIPAVVFAVVLARLSTWNERTVVLGIVAGVGLPLLAVAGLQWDSWQHRVVGDGTPNPYYWGGVGLLLLVVGVVAFAALRSRSS